MTLAFLLNIMPFVMFHRQEGSSNRLLQPWISATNIQFGKNSVGSNTDLNFSLFLIIIVTEI